MEDNEGWRGGYHLCSGLQPQEGETLKRMRVGEAAATISSDHRCLQRHVPTGQAKDERRETHE